MNEIEMRMNNTAAEMKAYTDFMQVSASVKSTFSINIMVRSEEEEDQDARNRFISNLSRFYKAKLDNEVTSFQRTSIVVSNDKHRIDLLSNDRGCVVHVANELIGFTKNTGFTLSL